MVEYALLLSMISTAAIACRPTTPISLWLHCEFASRGGRLKSRLQVPAGALSTATLPPFTPFLETFSSFRFG